MVRSREEAVVDSINLGGFWRYINKRLSHRDVIVALTDENGNVVICSEDKADMFNNYNDSVRVIDYMAAYQQVILSELPQCLRLPLLDRPELLQQ